MIRQNLGRLAFAAIVVGIALHLMNLESWAEISAEVAFFSLVAAVLFWKV